jgi:hypothetical protein
MPRHLNPVLQKPEVKHIEVIKSVAKPKNAFELLCVEVDDDEEVEAEEVEAEEVEEEEVEAEEVEAEEDELPDLSKVQWGKSLTKKSWADEVEEEEKKPRTWAQVVTR